MYGWSAKKRQAMTCDTCDAEVTAQTGYHCVTCQQVYCIGCKTVYGRTRSTKINHITTLLVHKISSIVDQSRPWPSSCDKHTGNSVSAGLNISKSNVYGVHPVESDQSQDCISRELQSHELKLQTNFDEKCRVIVDEIKDTEKREIQFIHQVDITQKEILLQEEALIDEIKKCSRLLQEELMLRTTEKLQKYDKVRNRLDHVSQAAHSVKDLTTTLPHTGLVDANNILDHAMRQVNDLVDTIPAQTVRFTATPINTDNLKALFGGVEYRNKWQYTNNPQQVAVIGGSPTTVFGVTCLDDYLYVLRDTTSTIEAFDTQTFEPSHSITVAGLTKPCGIASCDTNHCLYVVNYKYNGPVYRVTASADICSWPTIDSPWSVSVADNTNVLVTFTQQLLVEFTSEGEQVRDIVLSGDFIECNHALLLEKRLFVCQGLFSDSLHRVCEVDSDGQLIRYFGSSVGVR